MGYEWRVRRNPEMWRRNPEVERRNPDGGAT